MKQNQTISIPQGQFIRLVPVIIELHQAGIVFDVTYDNETQAWVITLR